jgi:hypothetical protein
MEVNPDLFIDPQIAVWQFQGQGELIADKLQALVNQRANCERWGDDCPQLAAKLRALSAFYRLPEPVKPALEPMFREG